MRATLAHLPLVEAAIGRPLPPPDQYRPAAAAAPPILRDIGRAAAHASPELRPLAHALAEHCDALPWRSAAASSPCEPTSAFIDLCAPGGLFDWDGPVVSVGIWAPGAQLDRADRDAARLYAVIAGSVQLVGSDGETRALRSGETLGAGDDCASATALAKPGALLALIIGLRRGAG